MAVNIISRAEWGAAAPVHAPVHVEWPVGVDLWVHHTDGPETQTPRQIQAFHQGPERGWNDIGYGYLIDSDGTIYEGRGYEIQAAHSPGVNHQPSVALIGDYGTTVPSDEMHRAVYDLRAHLRCWVLRGHRENTATSCPGDAAYAKIVKGPPPRPEVITLRERLMASWFGGRSADEVIRKLREGYEGDIPNPTDSSLYRALRDGGFGHTSAVRIVKATRRKS